MRVVMRFHICTKQYGKLAAVNVQNYRDQIGSLTRRRALRHSVGRLLGRQLLEKKGEFFV
jgi:hypothetical protein